MNLHAVKDFLKMLEYVCDGGTEEYQEDLFNDYEDKNEDRKNYVPTSDL